MPTYTIQTEAGNDDGTIWQAVHPSEHVWSDGTAQDLADEVADNQTVADGDRWRVLIWDGADADTNSAPTAIHTHDATQQAKRTGRPALDPDSATRAVPVRMTDTMLAELDRRAFTHGNRSEQIRRAIDEHLRGDYGAPTITATRDDDPQAIVDQITDVMCYLQHVSGTISSAAQKLRWMGDDEFEHRFDAANGAIGELYAALSQAEAPYAQRAREAACAAIPEGV